MLDRVPLILLLSRNLSMPCIYNTFLPPILLKIHRRAALDHYLMPAHYVRTGPLASALCLSTCLVFRRRASAPFSLRHWGYHPSHTPSHSVSPLLFDTHQTRAVLQSLSMHHLHPLLIVHTTSVCPCL